MVKETKMLIERISSSTQIFDLRIKMLVESLIYKTAWFTSSGESAAL